MAKLATCLCVKFQFHFILAIAIPFFERHTVCYLSLVISGSTQFLLY
ncbi:hypothetical protein GNE10_12415 [Nostoc sp. 2RC]|nr:hypothetical protein [Nostoc sp. 2RC]